MTLSLNIFSQLTLTVLLDDISETDESKITI